MMEDDSKIKLYNSRIWMMISMDCWDAGDSCECLDDEAFGDQFVYDFFKVKTSTCHLKEILSP